MIRDGKNTESPNATKPTNIFEDICFIANH